MLDKDEELMDFHKMECFSAATALVKTLNPAQAKLFDEFTFHQKEFIDLTIKRLKKLLKEPIQ